MKSPKIRFKEFQNEWDSTTLGEICNKFDNLRIPITENLRKKGSTPYYGANGIQDYVDGYTHDGEFVLIAEDGAHDIKNYPVQYVNGKIWVNNHAHVLQGKNGILNNIFLNYSILSINFEPILVGGSRAKLNASVMDKIQIRIPNDLKEQEAIGEFFKNIDEILDLEKERFKKFENFKKTMLDKLFVASGENTPRLRLSSFTYDWVSVTLGEVCEIIKGRQINKINLLLSGKYYVLNGGITPSGYTNSFNTNENIISISEGGNSCGFVNFNKEKFWSGGHNYTLQNLVINTRFLYALLKYREKNIMSLRVGSGLPNIQKSSLLEFKIQIPTDLKEQEAIGEFFKKIDEILESKRQKITKLENAKKYLLNKMFV